MMSAPLTAAGTDSGPVNTGAADAAVWTGAVPGDEVLEARGAVIGDIRIVTSDVFDTDEPGESNRLYRLTNRLHRTTNDDVIRRQLLFREGDAFVRREIEESERILRRNRYLYDAEVRVVRYRGNRVDVEVRTRDVWTLKPGFSVGRSGGVNSTDFKLQDHNLLGTGKSLTLKYSSDVDRDTFMVRYEHENFLDNWYTLKVHYGDSTDGGVRFLELYQPFYSLDSRWAAGVRLFDNDRVDSLYALGELTEQFKHNESVLEVFTGLSRGLVGGRARRWLAGFTYEQHRFGPAIPLPGKPGVGASLGDVIPDREPTDPLKPKGGTADPGGLGGTDLFVPEDRILSYPWIGFESRGNRFEEAHSLDQMGRTEDIELGYRYQARLGYMSEALGADREGAVFDASMSAGYRPTRRQTLLLEASASGRWEDAGAQNVHIGSRARFYWRNFGKHLFYVNLEADAVDHLDPENQLLLGGDSGLRGYPLRYQDGEQRLLLSLEQRVFTDFYPFRLFYVGGAVFFDIGRTWGEGATARLDQGLLRNVGLGLRLSSSRSGLGNVLHLDVAFPLDGGDSIEGVQWLVSTKKSF